MGLTFEFASVRRTGSPAGRVAHRLLVWEVPSSIWGGGHEGYLVIVGVVLQPGRGLGVSPSHLTYDDPFFRHLSNSKLQVLLWKDKVPGSSHRRRLFGC